MFLSLAFIFLFFLRMIIFVRLDLFFCDDRKVWFRAQWFTTFIDKLTLIYKSGLRR